MRGLRSEGQNRLRRRAETQGNVPEKHNHKKVKSGPRAAREDKGILAQGLGAENSRSAAKACRITKPVDRGRL